MNKKTEVIEMFLHMAHEAVRHSCNVIFEEFGYADTKLGHMTLPLVNLSDGPFQVKYREWFMTSNCNAHRNTWSELGTPSAIPMMESKRTGKEFGYILAEIRAWASCLVDRKGLRFEIWSEHSKLAVAHLQLQ